MRNGRAKCIPKEYWHGIFDLSLFFWLSEGPNELLNPFNPRKLTDLCQNYMSANFALCHNVMKMMMTPDPIFQGKLVYRIKISYKYFTSFIPAKCQPLTHKEHPVEFWQLREYVSVLLSNVGLVLCSSSSFSLPRICLTASDVISDVLQLWRFWHMLVC